MNTNKMAKISQIIIMAIAISIVSTACKNDNSKTNPNTATPVVQQNNENQNTSPSSEQKESYKPTEEILSADEYSGLVQIKNSVIELPCTVQDLLNIGFSIKTKDVTEDYLVDANLFKVAELKIDNKELRISAYNKDSSRKAFKDCYVYSISDFTENLTYMEDNIIFFPMGIQLGNTMDELFEKLGEGIEVKDSYDDIHYVWQQYPIDNGNALKKIKTDSGTGKEIDVRFDRNTSKAKSIRIENNQFPFSIENVETINKSYTDNSGNSVNVVFPYYTAIYDEQGRLPKLNINRVVEFEGKPYIVDLFVENSTAFEFYHKMYDIDYCKNELAKRLESYGESKKTFFQQYEGYNLYGQLNSSATSIGYRIEVHNANTTSTNITLGVKPYDGSSPIQETLIEKIEALYQRTLDEIVVE